jgi:putative DNA primase/helicase
MTETLYRTALSVGGRQGGQESEATQTEKPLSDLDFLILNGMDTAQIQKYLNDGIPLEELANAARGIVSRGESLADEPEAEDMPTEKAKPERQTKPQLTVDRLDEWLADNGISVSYNCISHAVEVEGVDPSYNPETVKSDLHIIVHDQLKRKYQCDRGLVADLLGVLAGKHRYNPVEVMLENAPVWDGVDRVEQLYKILCIEDDELSKALLHKWLWQCYSMAHNDTKSPFGADGLLVLQGKQGIGKTSFVRKIGVLPELVKLGQYLDSRDKDTIRRCTSCWICEWGEIETTLRSDLERLKAFITAEIDEYRLPYGRTDQTLCRRTSLIATCNTEQFLIDPTGSRRFWTVPVKGIDLEALAAMDALQLWKQIEAQAAGNLQGFRLTRQEQDELARRNTEHEKPLKAQPEIEDIISKANKDSSTFVWAYSTVTDFKVEHECLRAYSVEQIGKALDRLGYPSIRKSIDKRQQRVRCLPRYKWSVKSSEDKVKMA